MPAPNLTPSATSRRLRLRKRRDLRVEPLEFGRRRYWGVKDPVALRYYQLRDEEFRILQMLDGTTSLDDIRERFEREFAPRRLTPQQLESFIGMLHTEGLIVAEAPGQGRQLLRVRRRNERRQWIGRLSNVLAIRFRGLDPERLLGCLHPWFRWMYSPAAVAAFVLLALAALLLVAAEFDTIVARLPDFDVFFGLRNGLLLLATVAVVKVLHELGHGISCRHFGGECHEMGLMFLVFTPCLYMNVSDAWMLPSKWQRIAISGAGMYVEVLLASIATFLWWWSEPGLLNTLCLNLMFVCSVSTVLFNGNPLLRYDGYFILADLVEVPNLRQQSGAVIKQWLGHFFLDTELENPRVVPERGRGWLAAYAVASAIYRWIVVFAILWFVHTILKPHGLEVLARLLAVIVVGGMLVTPIIRAFKFLRDPARSRDVNWHRLLTRGGLVALVVLAIGMIPLPYRVAAPVVIEPEQARHVYVSVGGRLEKSVRPGDVVQAGATIGLLENLEIAREIAELRGQLAEQEQLVDSLRRRSLAGDASAGDQIPAQLDVRDDLHKRLEQRLQDQKRLTLVAPVAGTVLPPKHTDRQPPEGELAAWTGTPLDEENLGSYLEAGTMYCRIGDPRRLEAVLVVDQTDVQFVRDGQHVRILLDETPGQSLDGTVTQISAMDLRIAPRELAQHESLPTRPDETGTPRPVSPSYQVRVELEPHEMPLLVGAAGEAKIHVRSQTLLQRLARYLNRTFRMEL